MNKILEAAKAIEKQMTEDRRILHRRPELGFDLPETTAYVRKRLAEMGIPSAICGGPIDAQTRENFVFGGFPDMENSTGVVAVIGQGSPCILLRADMDALPMTEASGLDFASEKPGIAHTCGHDTHVAMLLGAAKLLKEREGELAGTVKLMFQTGEELGCGSKLMIDHGVLENPKVDAALAIHIMSQQEAGTVEYASGIASSALDTFVVKIKGKGGHSSMPQDTIDPLMIANQLYTALNLLSCREIDPRETVALTAGKCGGGTAPNIIPDTADVQTGVRTFNRDVRKHLNQRIPEIIDHTVKMWRGDYRLAAFHVPSTYTDEKLCEALRPMIADIVGEDRIRVVPASAATEDFGYITERVPGMMVWLGGGHKDRAPMHNPEMVVDEDVFAIGAAIFVNCAVKWLENQKQ